MIHDTADPLFPYGHGEALARGIPRAELLPLEGVGHQLPPQPWWPPVIAAMLRHTSGLPGDGFADGGDYLGGPADQGLVGVSAETAVRSAGERARALPGLGGARAAGSLV